jgi:REP element-mobilizing transposase RayT
VAVSIALTRKRGENMNERLLIAYHLIWTGYGWWLPNDPRGSGSTIVLEDHIAKLGEVHFGRKKVQPARQVVKEFYEEAKKHLKFPLLTFGERKIPVIADAFAETMQREKYTCYACAILLDHVHLLLRKHRDQGDDMIEKLQAAARERLAELKFFDPDHPVWTAGGWKRYLFEPSEVRGVIPYIERNPTVKQDWPFVKEYDGWPLHPGHSPNSPYARVLRNKQ